MCGAGRDRRIELNRRTILTPQGGELHPTRGAVTGGMSLEPALSYAGFWVTRRSGGVVCRHFDDLDAVFESDTCDDLRQLICALEAHFHKT
jgi:hypothetical protein